MRSKQFWVSLAERAGKTFAQTLVALWPISENALGLLDVDWQTSLSVAGLAALVSVLTSIASSGIGPDGSPSLVGEPAKVPETVLNADPDEAVHTGDNPVDNPAPDSPDVNEPGGRHVDDGEPNDLPVSRLQDRG